jgi:hypothetical protein
MAKYIPLQRVFGIAVDNRGVTIYDPENNQTIATYFNIEKGDTYISNNTISKNGVMITTIGTEDGFTITVTTATGESSTTKIQIS